MKTDERLLKYFSGLMSESEKAVFEKELSGSEVLRREADSFRQMMAEFKGASEYSSSHYFNTILPRVRERIDRKKSPALRLKIAYGLSAAAIIALLFIINPFSSRQSSNSDFETAVAEMNDTDKSSLLGEFIEMDQGNLRTVINSETGSSDAIESKVSDALFRNEESKGKYVDTDDLINDLTPQEADKVYDALLNKKIL